MSLVRFDETEIILDTDDVDNDVQELMTKLRCADAEIARLKKKNEDERFNYDKQRGQFLKMYAVKEDEVKELSKQLDIVGNEAKEAKIRDQHERIAELSQIVQDTVEESSSSQTQVKQLQKSLVHLEEQLSRLTTEKGDTLLLAPSSMISATKSFAKKVVSHLGSDADKSSEDLDDSMRKAKEDADVMRGLIIPLENEIIELKKQLQISEKKLVKYEKKLLNPESSDGSLASSCDLCVNYEEQLQAQQEKTKSIEKQKNILESNLEKFKEDLAKETQFRKEMEEKWNEKKEEQKLQIIQLKAEVVAGKNEIHELNDAFISVKVTVKEALGHLKFDRQEINDKMQKLQQANENLLGKHNQTSAELLKEVINFPDNVGELQELLLKLREAFISAVVAKEAKEEDYNTLKCEMELMQSEIVNEHGRRACLENEYTTENSRLSAEVDFLKKENMENLATISELKNRAGSLQQQLDSSETVQKDFVLLSQSLQIQLEKIRKENTEVRWQHDDDVDNCQGCQKSFPSPKKKSHCRHCGKIFCSACLQHSVKSGPKQRVSHVCQVCHTLLNSETAPYFSQDPPHSSV